MTGLEKDVLQNGLCEGCECTGFVAKLNYVVDATAKTATVTDASTFGAGDDLNVANIHVYDKNGKEKHGQITADAGNAVLDISSLNLSSIDILGTVISTKGCKADLGIYSIGSVALSGQLGNKNNQGVRD
ncbi:hypothetical protein C1637_09960 [Chryseobacterium lactis]|uniref:Uncharacterized protein n=1 Tax=Chryseobacterium lactis TaxID=1241981 RepID=A0A3G6RCP3_CHRLC|nr:hypothetical protein [Chryseobacterium lactis]AZA82164.1 hypothetical protein EG342_09735 [Chryseobacterium lactis]AZB02545.1 hypothetical protein EG341_00590 [Chryseobacterium lactis]PNW14159.1 hypothetical protein C1637_09960 [Chryseobacterium lactis]